MMDGRWIPDTLYQSLLLYITVPYIVGTAEKPVSVRHSEGSENTTSLSAYQTCASSCGEFLHATHYTHTPTDTPLPVSTSCARPRLDCVYGLVSNRCWLEQQVRGDREKRTVVENFWVQRRVSVSLAAGVQCVLTVASASSLCTCRICWIWQRLLLVRALSPFYAPPSFPSPPLLYRASSACQQVESASP